MKGELATPYGMGKLTGKDFYGMDTYVQFPASFGMIKGGQVVGMGTIPID